MVARRPIRHFSPVNRSSIFSGLRRRSYAEQAKLRHYPLANQRFLRSVGAVHTYLGSISAALSLPSAGSFPEQRLRIELTRGMTSDPGQNRYLLFMAPQILLPFENCSSSYCLLSSWRRFHDIKSCRSFVSSYCFLRLTTGLSFCREIFLS